MNGDNKNFGLLDFMKYGDQELPKPAEQKPAEPVAL